MRKSRSPRHGWKVLFMAGALALPAWAADRPEPGASLPSFTAKDLLGQEHSTEEYQGKRTLLVAITDKNAGDGMRHWFEAADTHAPESVQRESIISIHVPFFVGMATVRDRVQAQVPRPFWDDTLLDRNGAMADTLGLASSKQPYVFALDEHGRVLASAHGPPDSPEAQRIWSSLSGTRATGAPGTATSSPGGPHGPSEK
jgi:hypothetical protein